LADGSTGFRAGGPASGCNASGGSILIPVLFHYQMNLPIWPDAQPWENYLFAGVAVMIVIIERKSMWRRGQGVTEILAPSTQGGAEVPPSVTSAR
jgi:hypothetical protein